MARAEVSEWESVVALVNEQAEDEGLWFVAGTAAEAYLQQELRRLHAVIEAVGAPWGDGEPLTVEDVKAGIVAMLRRLDSDEMPDPTAITPADLKTMVMQEDDE